MAATKQPKPGKPSGNSTKGEELQAKVEEAITWLKGHATKATLDGMARYGIPSHDALGVAMRDIQAVAKGLGPKNHPLALALWKTKFYEARMLAAYVDEPDEVTPAQMKAWCHDFNNWGICDTVCFALFDRTPHAWSLASEWAKQEQEFVKRAAFALVWGLTVHDKHAEDEKFLQALEWVELAAVDERHYVKKAVNMALRATGKRNPTLRLAAIGTAQRLSDSKVASARWIGKEALRDLTRSK